jgi:tetratricopeptide (TPR) repeat protein
LRAVVATLILLLAGGFGWHAWFRPSVRAARFLAEARTLHASGDFHRAERAAEAALERDPALGEAALIAAECAASRHEFPRAIHFAGQVRTSDARLRLRATLMKAQLNHHGVHHFADAERDYRAALVLAPDDVQVNTGLAQLLALCGRSREAVPYILRIVRMEEPTDLLVLLARTDGVVNNSAALDAARQEVPDDVNLLLGLAWHAASDEDTTEAIRLLHQALRVQPGHLVASVALGRQWLVARRYDELARWVRELPAAADDDPEVWLIRARMAENSGDPPGAIRCYWESLRRAPESRPANFRLARLLAETGAAGAAARFSAQTRKLQELETAQNHMLFDSRHDDSMPLLELVHKYEAVGRLWEAYGWCQMAVRFDSSNLKAQHSLRSLRTRVRKLPLRQTIDAANIALAVDLSGYPLPHWQNVAVSPPSSGDGPAGAVAFRDDAVSTGLRFRYDNGTEGIPARRMFEFTGGGIGAVDFDLDGFVDVYFTQGGPWPPNSQGTGLGDRIFRNLRGQRFEDVTASAGVVGGGFGQGLAVGDCNADGFPDIYAAHIGDNRYWENNGDATFTDRTAVAGLRGHHRDWTTSCVIADLDGDGLSDIYAANYVTADDVFDRVCRHPDGSPKMCMPFDFEGQPDRLWLNNGEGGFRDASEEVLCVAESGKGLGVAAWDALGQGRLSLLVANDTTPNFFFVFETGPDGRARLRDRAIELGVALNGDGRAKGNMGIALGDVDDDGHMDLHITNFLAEANTFFKGLGENGFEDRTRETGLHHPTLEVLGFGTQFLDADLDGRLELFMANGHIDDFRKYGKPYRMHPKMFRWDGSRFVELAARNLGSYFEAQWLGRSVARLDWNRDGRDDLIVGHLEDETALLTNATPDAGRFLSIRLIGVQSNRDAIGTTVSARVGTRTIVRQLAAGDGYQASNERRLTIGVGTASQVDQLMIRWPSGIIQRFDHVATSQELWIVEGRPPVVIPGT